VSNPALKQVDDSATLAEAPDQDAFWHKHHLRKAKGIACSIKGRNDKKKAVHYMFETLKKALAEAPPRKYEARGDDEH
jgi:hypothetical protein